MTKPDGYKGHRVGATESLRRRRLKENEQIDVPLLWLLTWDSLTASQRYRIARGILL